MKSLVQYIIENRTELQEILKKYNKVEELKTSILGKEISEARKLLGHWWVLNNQSSSVKGGMIYYFSRDVKGKIEVYTNSENIVYDVKGFLY